MHDKKLNAKIEPSNELLNNNSRRQFIRGFGLMVGGGIAASLLSGNVISAAMAYKSKADSTLQSGLVFSRAELKTLQHICAQVIPTTDTPGAADVDTHGFIDHQLHHCHSEDERKATISLLGLITKNSKARHQTIFSEIKPNQQVQLLNDLEQAKKEFSQQNRVDFKRLKLLICFGYYTSEVGGSKELRYLPIPGGFKGSIPYVKGDASWSIS